MSFIIAVAVIVYLVIGCFFAGFLDLDPKESGEFMLFAGTVFLWPVAIGTLIVVVVFGYPMILGRKLGARYLERCEEFFDKLIDREVG